MTVKPFCIIFCITLYNLNEEVERIMLEVFYDTSIADLLLAMLLRIYENHWNPVQNACVRLVLRVSPTTRIPSLQSFTGAPPLSHPRKIFWLVCVKVPASNYHRDHWHQASRQ